jgi:hypothetical protein
MLVPVVSSWQLAVGSRQSGAEREEMGSHRAAYGLDSGDILVVFGYDSSGLGLHVSEG